MKNMTLLHWLYLVNKKQYNYVKLINELCSSQWLSADLIAQRQLIQLKQILEFAKKHTAYYHNTLKNVSIDHDITCIKDVNKIPRLPKKDVREKSEEMKSDRKDLFENQTGGSTGIPLNFYNNKDFLFTQKIAANIRAYTVGGYRLGDKIGVIWGFDNDLPQWGLKGKIINHLIAKQYNLNSFKLSKESMAAYIQRLAKSNVRYIKGYATSLFEIASFILDEGFKFKHQINALYSEAEKLDPQKREIIERAFNAKVFNLYGSREFGTIGIECIHHSGLHVNFEQLLVEVDSNNEILITSFCNLGTPMIRYEIGDLAEKLITEKCACGRASYRLSKIIGRESDNFKTANGKIIHGEYITHLFYNKPSIKQFQVIQKSFYNLIVKVVASQHDVKQEIGSVVEGINKAFGNDITINVEFVDSIEKSRTGKIKFTIRDF